MLFYRNLQEKQHLWYYSAMKKFDPQKLRGTLLGIVAAFVFVATIVLVFGNVGKKSEPTPLPSSEPTSVVTANPADTFSFKNEKALKEHFEKHGRDMGFTTAEEYVEAANEVIKNPDSLCKLEEEDRDFVYYLESKNYIVFLSQKGVIRSFFSPSDGISYFNRQ